MRKLPNIQPFLRLGQEAQKAGLGRIGPLKQPVKLRSKDMKDIKAIAIEDIDRRYKNVITRIACLKPYLDIVLPQQDPTRP